MRFIFSALFSLCFNSLLTCIPHTLFAQALALAEAKECRERQGLPNFFRKLESHKPVTIAYFGGSITEAGKGWREQSTAWFQKKYPKAKISAVNAAIGGTGSDLGVFRLQQHVLAHHPDLVFVEFAVNDAGRKPEDIYKSMEGIVRQIWQQNNTTDICFVYTLTADMAPTLQEGKFPQAASAMERIADYYQIPSVHMGLEVVKLAKNNELVFKGKPEDFPGKLVFSGDNVHPYPQTGHKLYTEALVRSLPALAITKRNFAHTLEKPFVANNWERAKMIPVKEATFSRGWQVIAANTDTVARQLQNQFSYLIKAEQPGETITIRFKGTRFGLYDVMGPGCGQYEIKVDGNPAILRARFDAFSTYYRANYFFLPDMEDTLHTIELTVSAKIMDKAAILAKRSTTIDNPAKYTSHACYASQLMIIGELVK
ncbi:SGNH/GDSL hydrolase family protein [Rhodocytophaga rosea]|uniref:SGNH/GDSL hydrolase family protein n=1 Tax=Rhodocytophaga rosea TaxID=2704465 RepID=A0A6C0GFE2_9BACT|nr:SGNH/GDSL hydrolase family protein [Rhodocytophaga rosea]QHT66741.1 SGNH/GDSL hydrolase family protein [Rhodocytophaga rosea]